ncbi:MAG TPA: M48 family metalloprotease [Kofleriaceae bacterium]
MRVDAPTAAEQAGIAAAIAMWRGHGITTMSVTDSAAEPTDAITIKFADAADAFHGVYDPPSASILINRDLASGDTAGALAIVIAHELGHVYGLVHVDPAERLSLMNAGNLWTPPTDGDQTALQTLWGVCPSAP